MDDPGDTDENATNGDGSTGEDPTVTHAVVDSDGNEVDAGTSVRIDSTDVKPRVDEPLFMFAAGFGFGVALTLVVLAVALSAVDGEVSLSGFVGTDLAALLVAAAVFAVLVASGLFVLSIRPYRQRLERAFDRLVSKTE